MKSEAISGALLAGVVALLAGAYFIPWHNVSWGSVTMQSPRTVTVTGEATKQESNQLASFSAGVESRNVDKQTAIDSVNAEMNKIIESVKALGITEADIKTQNMSVYQSQESYYDNGAQRTRPGEWMVSNSVDITVRDVAKVDELNKVLSSSGATNVYGPNYRTDDTQRGDDLLSAAVANAREKAQALADSEGVELGSVLGVIESGSVSNIVPMYRMDAGGGGGAAALPGSTTLSKSVSVTFEIE